MNIIKFLTSNGFSVEFDPGETGTIVTIRDSNSNRCWGMCEEIDLLVALQKAIIQSKHPTLYPLYVKFTTDRLSPQKE